MCAVLCMNAHTTHSVPHNYNYLGEGIWAIRGLPSTPCRPTYYSSALFCLRWEAFFAFLFAVRPSAPAEVEAAIVSS